MKTIEILMAEHQLILKNLTELENLLPNLNDSNVAQVEPYLRFIEIYADQFHHAKEEDLLFQWMIKHQPQMGQGPIACMLKEHDSGRSLIRSAKEELTNSKVDVEKVSHNLEMFINLLRDHINKEDNVLYNFAIQINQSTQDGDSSMLNEFYEIESRFAPLVSQFKSNSCGCNCSHS